MPIRDLIIATIRGVANAAQADGKINIILPWKTETIFTTKGLDAAFPPETQKTNRYFRTGHNIVYDVLITLKDRTPVQISFLAMFTELSKEPANIDRRNEILRLFGRAPTDRNYVRINLMERLPVSADAAFLNTLKQKVEYFINIAIPAFEKTI